MEKLKSIMAVSVVLLLLTLTACKSKNTKDIVSGDAAAKSYVAPGKYDEFYNFVSGGFSGQMSVYGLPSGRLFRVIPVFSVKFFWLKLSKKKPRSSANTRG